MSADPDASLPAETRPVSSWTILLVDDDPIHAAIVRELALAMGHHCETARPHQGVLDAVRRGLADLVIVDCGRPGSTGYDTVRAIRGLERDGGVPGAARRIPIVAMTIDATSGAEALCREAGIDACVAKPLDFGGLGSVVERWLASPPETPPPAIDLVALLERCMGRQELLERLVGKFLDQGDRDLASIEQAAAARDARALAFAAHRLKGASANLTAEPTRQIAASMEALSKGGRLDEAAALVPVLRQALSGFRAAAGSLGAKAVAP